MKWLSFFKREQPKEVARNRIRILLAHERSISGSSNLIALLRNEILLAVAKYIPVDLEQVDVNMQRGELLSTLQIDIQIPVSTKPREVAACDA
ncbi:MAG: cell division topological specificity factor MinE [Pseudomonadota bacterium]